MCQLSQYWIATEFFKNHGATFKQPNMDQILKFGTTDEIMKYMFRIPFIGQLESTRFPPYLPPELPREHMINQWFIHNQSPNEQKRNIRVAQNFGLFIEFSDLGSVERPKDTFLRNFADRLNHIKSLTSFR